MSSESSALLAPNYARTESPGAEERARRVGRVRAFVGLALGLLVVLVGVPTAIYLTRDSLPRDPVKAVDYILRASPIIDGHIDLPDFVRNSYANNVSAVNLENSFPGDVDIPRLRRGHVGGFFWSVYSSCPSGDDVSDDFTKPHNPVRDTLEQIDVAKGLMRSYPKTFALVTTADEVRVALAQGKIAGLLGVEGGHQLGNSLGVLRQYAALGVRYMTLTHACNNAFADSAGIFSPVKPVHGGLSALGRALIKEMNRLGVIVDVSHVSDDTARQAISLSRAPVMWSHSSVRAITNISRNVPDEFLRMINQEEGRDGVVMINFVRFFVRPDGNATVEDVADHVEHVANIAGRDRVGLGSDFDGAGPDLPRGLEDVSKYPALFEILLHRGWTRNELSGLAGGNVLRIIEKAEQVAKQMEQEGVQPAYDLYHKRKDLPVRRHDDF